MLVEIDMIPAPLLAAAALMAELVREFPVLLPGVDYRSLWVAN